MSKTSPTHRCLAASPVALAALLASRAALAQQAEAPAPALEVAAPLTVAPLGGVSFVGTVREGEAPPTITADGAACALPCRLPLAPGVHRLGVQGLFTQSVTLSSPDAVVELRRRDAGHVLSGSLLVAFGTLPFGLGALGLTGLGIALLGSPSSGSSFFGSNAAWGGVSLGFGVAFAVVAVPMIVVGALRIANAGPRFVVQGGRARLATPPRFALGQGVLLDAATGAPVPTALLRF